ncbi:class I SAM-dependent methyltransferase [Sedimentitalea todarodis]|uniref:Class I SAM-dependent methyltransferase n=1 Tax=Sedimentitalea todarodis TaxID=1631240 RepID=A0ABU3VDD5_9RHOB|nr:class I SAM-dependent methyltransferase [Sedimentitalea todarodis]MDU9004189.1 class I SAM-dependent methyltransferase [Sedimentitalea todarodis]
MSARLPLAIDTGGLLLPETGVLSVLHPVASADLSALPIERTEVVQSFKPDFDHFLALGYSCVPSSDTRCSAALVCLPRAKALARAQIATACRRSTGLVIVDGAKTDGIDSMLRECRKRVDVCGPVAKSHGKLFWFAADPEAFADWQAVPQTVSGFVTAPGVFSADGIDPASELLGQALPAKLGTRIVDLGAGWGYLAAQVLKSSPVERLDLVEADAFALDCARQNLSDPRARFHWADATNWAAEGRVDTVVMNPPFHIGRTADPSLGRAFVAAAARMLAPSGQLWLVANRHLPYERTLDECFAKVEDAGGDSRFKIFHAARPKTASKSTPTRMRR